MKDLNQEKQQLSARVKEELPQFMEEQFGHLEQQPPHKPSFLLVVCLFGVTIIVVFIVAWAIVRWGGGARFLHKARTRVPTAQLIMPAIARPAPQARVS